MTKSAESYQSLKQKLDQIIEKLQSEDIDIDEAIKLHEEGRKVIEELEKYLEKTKHKFETIKPKA